MNYKMMGQFVARIVGIEAAFMVPPLLISLFCGESASVRGFLWALAAIAVVEAVLLCIKEPDYLRHITAGLYPAVARRCQASAQQVERAMQFPFTNLTANDPNAVIAYLDAHNRRAER